MNRTIQIAAAYFDPNDDGLAALSGPANYGYATERQNELARIAEAFRVGDAAGIHDGSMAGFSAGLLVTGVLTAGGVASEVEAGTVAVRGNVQNTKWGVDSDFLLADEAAGLIVNGRYIRNPTAQRLASLIGDSGKIRVGGQLANGQYMYVVDTNGVIVIGTRGGLRMPHPTLVGGENPQVFAAGILDIRGGKIFSINNASGHFKPGIVSLDAAETAFSGLPANIFRNDFTGYVPCE